MHQIACRAGPLVASLTAESGPVVVLIAAFACWIVVVQAIGWLTRPSTPPPDVRRGDRLFGTALAFGEEPGQDRWLAPHRGPTNVLCKPHGGEAAQWLIADLRHRTPVQVVGPADVVGATERSGDRVAAAMLEDLAGPVFDTGGRGHRRCWGGVLLHGADPSETAQLAVRLAAGHHVPLLVVRAHDIVPVDQRPVVEPVVTLAESMAPCVLFVEGLDDLADPAAPLVVSRHARRIEHELATAVRTADRTTSVVLLGSARAADAVARSLLQDRCFDRVVAVRTATRRERELLIHIELLRHEAVLEDALDDAMELTRGMRRDEIVSAVHRACRVARQRTPAAALVAVSLVDLRTAIRHPADDGPLAVGATHEGRARELVGMAHDAATSFGLMLAGDPDNGGVHAARWIASRTRRSVKWIDGGALDAVSAEDIEHLVASGLDDLPAVVVWDGLDTLLDGGAADGRRRKSVLAAVERLAQTPGAAIIATVRQPTLLDPALIDAGTVEVMWIGAPRFHDRVALLTHELRHAVLSDTTVEDLAAALVGATRAQVVARCHAALHTAAFRLGAARTRTLMVHRADFGMVRGSREQ